LSTSYHYILQIFYLLLALLHFFWSGVVSAFELRDLHLFSRQVFYH
jgi:hypothetical protein